MIEKKSWKERRKASAELLERRTGTGVDEWNERVRASGIDDEAALKTWLTEQGVTGFARTMLVRERLGYPDSALADADELVDGQYADRPDLRPIYDLILDAVDDLGEVTVQARKAYVSLMTGRRTFATVKATTKKRIDLGLRLEGVEPTGRLESGSSMRDESSTVRIALGDIDQVDDEVRSWLRRAYEANV